MTMFIGIQGFVLLADKTEISISGLGALATVVIYFIVPLMSKYDSDYE